MESQDNQENEEINLLELLLVLVRRKMLIVKICGFAVVAAVIYSLTLPNIYSATAKVLPPQKETSGGLSSLLGQAGGGLAGLAAASLGSGSDLYIGILKSRSVADAVIQHLDLVKVYGVKSQDAARRKLEAAVKVQAGKDGIISITTENTDPKVAALLANAMADELGKMTVKLNLSKVGGERLFLEKRLEVVKKDLVAAEEDLKRYAQQNKIVQVDAQAEATIAGIARLKADLASKEVQLSVLRSSHTDRSPQVKALVTGIQQLKAEIGHLSGDGGGGEGIPSIGNVPGVGLEYSRKMRAFKTQEAVFEQLTKQYEMARLSEAKDSSTLQILDEAVAPEHKSSPSRSRIVIWSAVSALFLSICLVYLFEYFKNLPEDDKAILSSIKTQALRWR